MATKNGKNIKKHDGRGFSSEIELLVSGSVSHFGHTHYRCNLKNELVVFVQDGNVWKIKDIEVIEETRLIELAMISIKKLEFGYPTGNFKLTIPSFTVEHGEKVAVIGPSGTGKTTLLNLVAGILPCTPGMLTVSGQDIGTLKDQQRRHFRINTIGFVFQDFALLDYLSISDNILHAYRISRAIKLTPEIRQRAAELADEMGIGDKLRQFPINLSQGEQQRVAICRALLTRPKLILADEATGNLDPDNKNKILEQLFTSTEKHEAALLAVTHDYELLSAFDRVVDFRSFLQGNSQ